MLQGAANSPPSFLAAPGRRAPVSGSGEAAVAGAGAGSGAPGVSPLAVCGLEIRRALGLGKLEKGTKKSNWFVGTNLLGRALRLRWVEKGLWEGGHSRAVRAAGLLGTGGRGGWKHGTLLKGEGERFFNAGDCSSV